jgi:deoxycytidylate deaminase
MGTEQATTYPYMPAGRTIEYVPADNPYMQAAKEFAREGSLDDTMPNASVVVKDGEIIGQGANGSDYHKTHECERIKRGIPTGQGYELCEGCSPHNHSEQKAVANARERGADTSGADLYLWGHWWCCQPCWDVMTAAGIARVFLLEGSEKLFNKSDPDNIIGKQFA